MPFSNRHNIDSDDDDSLDESPNSEVLLGVPDGVIDATTDMDDPMVSRLGGRPAFLEGLSPPLESGNCRSCSLPMELIVQLWCPVENSPMDRVLYVWGCSRAGCQRKDGCIRAFRGLRYNSEYAVTLESKAVKESQANEQPNNKRVVDSLTSNPFSMGLNNTSRDWSTPDFFDSLNVSKQSGEDSQPSLDKPKKHDERLNEVTQSLSETRLDDPSWTLQPSYTAMYLATVNESLAAVPANERERGDGVVVSDDNGGWSVEAYENSLEVDPVFTRFARRIASEGEQCIRYDLGGKPLLFQADGVFERLFRSPIVAASTVTSAVYAEGKPRERHYDGTTIDPCPLCQKRRVFECQLMPYLIFSLKTSSAGGDVTLKETEEQRRNEIRRLLGGLRAGVKSDERTGMEWGTCLIFSCEADCCLERKSTGELTQAQSCWREEVVLVQWDE